MRTTLCLLLLASSTAIQATAGELTQKRPCFAFVIGNANYEQLGPLPNPMRDADVMEEKFKAAGCQVTRINNFRGIQRDHVAKNQLAKVTPGSDVFFYYSGHGGTLGGDNYLLPIDLQFIDAKSIQDHSVQVNSVLNALEERHPHLTVLILDSCRTGLDGKGIIVAGYRQEANNPGTILILAAAPGKAAYGFQSDKYSLFTGAFQTHFVNGKDLVSAFLSTAAAVQQKSKGMQMPWVSMNITEPYCLGGTCGQGLAPAQTVLATLRHERCQSKLPFPYEREGKFGYRLCDGTEITGPIYSSAGRFTFAGKDSKPRAAVKIDGRYTYIDEFGHETMEPQFDSAFEFHDGLAPVRQGSRWYVIGLDGSRLSGSFKHVGVFSQGLAAVQIPDRDRSPKGLWGFISKENRKLAIAAEYQDAKQFGENGLAPVRLDQLYGFIDTEGKMVIKPAYEDALPFGGGLAPVRVKGLWGFIDRSGKMVIQPKFSQARPHSEQLAAVEYETRWGYIDRKGQFLIAPAFVKALDFIDGAAMVARAGLKSERWAAINAQGNYVF